MITFSSRCKFKQTLHILLILWSAFFLLKVEQVKADLDILIVGSTHSFSEGNEAGVLAEKAFNPGAVASELQSILANDPAVNTQAVNVVFEDIYTNKTMSVWVDSATSYTFNRRCYSLAQWYMWPEGLDARRANLRGVTTPWDYVIVISDPYILANFPGMYAEGVKMLIDEVKAGTAEPILFAQWPENSSSNTASLFNEIVYRVGDSAAVRVVPGGKAWDALTPQDSSTSHPTPNGAYLAAASIYSTIYSNSAAASAYTYPTDGDAIADHAFSVVQVNSGASQYTGVYTNINVFSMKYVKKRLVTFSETGTSTEDRLMWAMSYQRDHRNIDGIPLEDRCGVLFTKTGTNPLDFNYGRGNDWFEDEKDYEVNPALYDRSYGFPMHDYYNSSASNTMRYGIDKQYYNGTTYNDGTDLGIAYNMVRPGPPITRELSLPEDVRAIPIRLLWLKMREVVPTMSPLEDDAHMSVWLNDASVSFLYTLLSGRCGIFEEPPVQGSDDWMEWFGTKVGYETAWQMSHLTTRAPGLRVVPSSAQASILSPGVWEEMAVNFANAPESPVLVTVSSDTPSAALVNPREMRFTSSNHLAARTVRVLGLEGASLQESFNINYDTSSTDAIYDSLNDRWSFVINRASTQSVVVSELAVRHLSVEKNGSVTIDLLVPGSTESKTVINPPFNGAVLWAGQDVMYTPDADFVGTDSLSYAVNMGGTLTKGYIIIEVNAPGATPTVSVFASDASASEAGPDNGVWTISRTGATTSPLEVYFTMEGTAANGSDYNLSDSGSVTIGVGQSSATVTLMPSDDGVQREGDETAILLLSTNASYAVGADLFTIAIEDNDNTLPVVSAGTNQTVYLSGLTPWSPSNMVVYAWWDASDASTISQNSGYCSQWNDKSGNGNHLVNGANAIYKPQYRVSDSNLNGMPSLGTQDANNRYFDDQSMVFKRVYAVAYCDGGTTTAFRANNSLIGAGDDSVLLKGVGGQDDWNTSATSFIDTCYRNGSSNSITQNILPMTATLWRFDSASAKSSHRWGVLGVKDANTTWYGGVGEIILTDGSETEEDRLKLEGYLAHKWGLAVNLPADHPYKYFAPTRKTATASLSGTATDGDGDPLTVEWSLENGPDFVAFGSAAASNTTVTLAEVGSYTLRFAADDGADQQFDECIVTVAPDPFPVVSVFATDASAVETNANNETGSWTITRGGNTNAPLDVHFALTGTAVDASDYSLNVTSPVTIPAGQLSVTITLTPVDDSVFLEYDETAILTISNDAAYNISAASGLITIGDNDFSDPPAFLSDPVIAEIAVQDAAYSSSISAAASDPEGDPMTFTKLSGPSWLSVAANGGLSGTPLVGDVGTNLFTVAVDAVGGSDTGTVRVMVAEPAVPPVVTNLPVAPAGGAAVISGSLADGTAAEAWICWGTVDGGVTSTGAWEHVIAMGQVTEGDSFGTTASGLDPNRTYWFRCYVSNPIGTDWSDDASSFGAVPVDGSKSSIGINIVGSAGVGGTLSISDIAGYVEQTNWNNMCAANQNDILSTIYDSHGVLVSGMTVNTGAGDPWDSRNASGAANDFLPHGKLFEGFILDNDFDAVWTNRTSISGIPYARYDLYVYINGDNTGSAGLRLNGGGTAFYSGMGLSPLFTGYTICDDTVAPADGTFNTIVFTNVTASTVNIEWMRTANRIGMSGIQIVEVPDVSVVNLSPTNISAVSASLNAQLSVGAESSSVSVYWGTSDGADDAAAWTNSAYVDSFVNTSTSISYTAIGLDEEQTYYCTFMASNASGAVWASPSWQFTTPAAGYTGPVHTITASAGTGGSITPSGAVEVHEGTNQAFAITSGTGYYIQDVLVDGGSQGAVGSYEFSNVVTDHTISASFAVYQYNVIFDEGTNGHRTGGGALTQLVNYGSAAAVPTMTADTNYIFIGWDTTAYTNVTSNMTVAAQYALDINYTLTYGAGPHGSISGSTPQTVAAGSNGTPVTAIADEGYHFVDWSDSITDNPRTDTGVGGDISVTANFEINQYTVIFDEGGHGFRSGGGALTQTVDHAAAAVAPSMTADSGYIFSGWNTTAYTNVTSNLMVIAQYSVDMGGITVLTNCAAAGTYSYIVPEGVTEVIVKAWGAGGGGGRSSPGQSTYPAGPGGGGGFVQGTYAVTPGDTLAMTVGGGGGAGPDLGANRGPGGGGGGYSSVSNSTASLLLVVAGGGGGGGGSDNVNTVDTHGGAGGAGGGMVGGAGADGGGSVGAAGSGGSQVAGGIGPGDAGDGAAFTGGAGADSQVETGSGSAVNGGAPGDGGHGGQASAVNLNDASGGGGGGGYFGGGGGDHKAKNNGGSGGGGGSSYTNSLGSATANEQGNSTNAANGADVSYTGTAGRGGAVGGDGSDGLVVILAVIGTPPAVTTNHSVPHAWLDSVATNAIVDYEGAVLDDPDHDGFSTWQEYWSGTDPYNSNSYLRIDAINLEGGNVRIDWQHQDVGVGIPPLAIEANTDLVSGVWIKVDQKAPMNGLNSWSNAALQKLYYRLAVTNAP